MQINSSRLYDSPSKTNFKGRTNIPPEKFFKKLIDNVGSLERQEIEARIFREEQANLPIVKTTFIHRVKEAFSNKNEVSKVQAAPKTLKELWAESVGTMKTLVETKLSDDYVLRCRKSNFARNSLSFSLTKGKEYIYGVSASIGNPKFPVARMDEIVGNISKGRNPYAKTRNPYAKIL